MLRNPSRLNSDVGRQLVDRMLTMDQRPHDLQPRRVGQQLEYTSRFFELICQRLLNYLRIHAASVLSSPRWAGFLGGP